MKFLFFAFLITMLSLFTSGCEKCLESYPIVFADSGLPSVKSLIAKPELNGLLKRNHISGNAVAKLTSALTGYDEQLIGLVIGLVNTDDFDFPAIDKISSMKFSEENYSSIVTATVASMLVNGFPISEAGDTKIGCILISKILPLRNLSSLSGGTITIWIEAKDGEISVHGISKINQSYDIFGVNDKRLGNVFNDVKKYLGHYPSFEEANGSVSK
jgi:hypothetical protein